MIVASVAIALLKFAIRSSRQRKDGSSWKPTGIRGYANEVAGTTAARTSRQPRMSWTGVMWVGGSNGASRTTLPRLPDGGASTNTHLTSLLLVGRRTAHALDLASPLLGRKALLDRLAVRARRPPRPSDAEGVAEGRDEPFDGKFAVAELAALVLCDGAECRARARDHSLLLRVRERR